MKIIKGCPRDQWESVQAVQGQPFIYIMSNGSKFAGEEQDDISVLMQMLKTHTLDPRFADPVYGHPFYTDNPCEGIRNPNWTHDSKRGVPQFIDGPRLYAAECVVRFSGNFLTYSHVFTIDTNDQETIDELKHLIDANMATAPYKLALKDSRRVAA